jgi:hypothetical protein
MTDTIQILIEDIFSGEENTIKTTIKTKNDVLLFTRGLWGGAILQSLMLEVAVDKESKSETALIHDLIHNKTMPDLIEGILEFKDNLSKALKNEEETNND